MSQERPDPEDTDAPESSDSSDGQVSEVGRLKPDDADTPVSDDQSVAGSPSDESGATDEGPTGPNARAGSDNN